MGSVWQSADPITFSRWFVACGSWYRIVAGLAFDTTVLHNGTAMSEKNQPCFGDNLNVPGRYVADEPVDLVYLDPPFNSNANYNVLFKEHDGAEATPSLPR